MKLISFVFSTAVYVLGLIASTSKGAEVLHEFGWESVRHARIGANMQTSNVIDDSEDGLVGSARQLYRPNSLQIDCERQASGGISGSPTEAANSMFVAENELYFGSCSSCPPELPPLSEQSESRSRLEPIYSLSQTKNRPRLPSVHEGRDSEAPSKLEVHVENTVDAEQLSHLDVCYKRSPDVVGDFPTPGRLSSDPLSDFVNHGFHSRDNVPARTSPERNSNQRTLPNGPGKSCSDITATVASSGISSYESGTTYMPGITSHTATETDVSSSLDIANQKFLGAEAAASSESSESLRQFSNLRPLPTATLVARSSRTLPCVRTGDRKQFSFAARYGRGLITSSQDLEGYAALWELKPPRTSNHGTLQVQGPVSLANPYLSKTKSLDFRPSRPR